MKSPTSRWGSKHCGPANSSVNCTSPGLVFTRQLSPAGASRTSVGHGNSGRSSGAYRASKSPSWGAVTNSRSFLVFAQGKTKPWAANWSKAAWWGGSSALWIRAGPSQSSPNHCKMPRTSSCQVVVVEVGATSSIRMSTLPPRWRAKAQLATNVRALPRCSPPVGLGASRVVGTASMSTAYAGQHEA